MFNIGIGELLMVLVVAFVIVGPDDLPRVARWLGRQVRNLKRMLREIKQETGWDEVEKEVRDISRDVKHTVKQVDISADLRDAAKDVKAEVKGVAGDVKESVKALDGEISSAEQAARKNEQQED